VEQLLIFLGVILLGFSVFYIITVYKHEKEKKKAPVKEKKYEKELRRINDEKDAGLKSEIIKKNRKEFKKFLTESKSEISGNKGSLKRIYKNQNFLKEDIELLEKGKWWEKTKAIERLKNLEIKEAEKDIFNLLYNEKLDVRLASLDYLSKINSPLIQNEIKNIFEKNSAEIDQFLLIKLFSANLSPKSLKTLANSPKPRLRRASAILLGRKNKKENIPPLKKLSEDPEPNIRIEVVRSIGKIGLKDGLSILTKLKDDEKSKIRAEVARSIGKIEKVEDLSLLENLAQDEVKEVRLEAFLSLAKFGETGREIIEKYRKDYPQVSREAMLRSFNPEV